MTGTFFLAFCPWGRFKSPEREFGLSEYVSEDKCFSGERQSRLSAGWRQFHVVDFPPVPRSPHVRPTLAFANLACALWLARSTNVESNSKTKTCPGQDARQVVVQFCDPMWYFYTTLDFPVPKARSKAQRNGKTSPGGQTHTKFAIFPNGNLSRSSRSTWRAITPHGNPILGHNARARARRWCPARRRGRRGPRRRRGPGMGS